MRQGDVVRWRTQWFVYSHWARRLSQSAFVDVGGGEQDDAIPTSLANISFRWMLHEIQRLDCGVVFDNNMLDGFNVPIDCVRRTSGSESLSRIHSDDTAVGEEDPNKASKVYTSIPSWKEADRSDAEAAMHDQLRGNPIWYLLQSPFKGTRSFPVDPERKNESYIHPTVVRRMEVIKGYRPNATLPTGWESFVVREDEALAE